VVATASCEPDLRAGVSRQEPLERHLSGGVTLDGRHELPLYSIPIRTRPDTRAVDEGDSRSARGASTADARSGALWHALRCRSVSPTQRCAGRGRAKARHDQPARRRAAHVW
jgi:hypothetical protein